MSETEDQLAKLCERQRLELRAYRARESALREELADAKRGGQKAVTWVAELKAELEQYKTKAPFTGMREIISPCGHSGYWIGNYGTCMACRAQKAESELAQVKQQSKVQPLKNLVGEAEEMLRASLVDDVKRLTARAESAESSLVKCREALRLAENRACPEKDCPKRKGWSVA